MNMQPNSNGGPFQPYSDNALWRMRGDAISRREAVRLALLGAGGLMLGRHLSLRALAETPSPQARAKSVIQIWMWGGPAHLDTFDPKPEAGNDYSGPLNKPIATNVDGIRIGELMPLLAKQADKYSIIRSMTHGAAAGGNAHETASYMVQTSRPSGGHDVYPCIGAVVSLFKGYNADYRGLIPPYIVLTEPQGRFSEAGFLGSRFQPFATGGDPSKTPFAVEGVVSAAIPEKRQVARRELMHQLDTLAHVLPANAELAASAQCEKEAYDLILGDAGKVFDLTQEKAELRDSYGRTTFGQSCLVARRLVERGVPYITINYNGGWDTHKDNFPTMRKRVPEMDKGMATLLQDLSDHGLLDKTIVWWGGEFGRTPKVMWESPWNGGRGHHGECFCAVLAGGGFKGGQVVGASDDKGEQVKERPVYPADLLGSMYALLGIDGEAKLPHPAGLDVRVSPTAAEGVKRGGLLKEIM
jgi:hypothetical protein